MGKPMRYREIGFLHIFGVTGSRRTSGDRKMRERNAGHLIWWPYIRGDIINEHLRMGAA